MRTMKHLALAAMAATALALAGCGGGGGGGGGDTSRPMPPMPPMTASVTLPSDGDAYLAESDLMLADQTISLAAGESMDVGAYTLSCSDAGPCEVTIEDGAVTATGEVTATYTTAALATIADGRMTEMAESDGRAAGLYEALTRSGGADDIFGAGVTITPVQIPQAGWDAATVPDIVITRGLTGDLMVTRDRAHWEGDATDAASLGAEGWAGKVLTNGATQSVTVYSNIANAVREDFEADSMSIYVRNQATAGDIAHLPDATTDAAGVLALPAASMEDAAQQGLLDLNHFPGKRAPASGTVTYNYQDDPDPGPRNRRKSFTGTFHGASGTYACTAGTGTDCTIAVTPANAAAPTAYAATGDWTFTPDGEANSKNDAQLVKQDNNWLAFGWWMNEPASTGPGGEFLYNARVFFHGADVFDQASIAGLGELPLTFNGPAAGLYARQANETDGVTSARGEFMADAELKARFGRAGGAADVSGTIDNFTNGDDVDMSGWKLNLQRTAVAAGTSGATGGDVTSGTATNVAGSWEYTLYGPHSAGKYPSGIAGRFFAAIDGNTAVAGGFGAER